MTAGCCSVCPSVAPRSTLLRLPLPAWCCCSVPTGRHVPYGLKGIPVSDSTQRFSLGLSGLYTLAALGGKDPSGVFDGWRGERSTRCVFIDPGKCWRPRCACAVGHSLGGGGGAHACRWMLLDHVCVFWRLGGRRGGAVHGGMWPSVECQTQATRVPFGREASGCRVPGGRRCGWPERWFWHREQRRRGHVGTAGSCGGVP